MAIASDVYSTHAGGARELRNVHQHLPLWLSNTCLKLTYYLAPVVKSNLASLRGALVN